MQHSAEMQIYKEILDKMRQLMTMEGQEEEEGIEGAPFKAAAPEMVEELGEALGEDEDKAEDAEAEALAGEKPSYKEDMAAFFGGKKPLMPAKKGLKVGITEIAMMPKAKKPKY
jgi:hypothetical protein